MMKNAKIKVIIFDAFERIKIFVTSQSEYEIRFIICNKKMKKIKSIIEASIISLIMIYIDDMNDSIKM